MFQFFVEDDNIEDDRIRIEGSDVNHIRNVLRMREGEDIRVSTDSGRNFFCEIGEIQEDVVYANVLEEDFSGTELPSRIYLYQGLPKGDKMEMIIQKAVELGVYKIIPVAMKNCVVKLDEKRAENKVRRWQAISESAAKQCKRSIIPQIGPVMPFMQAAELAMERDVRIVPYENERGMAKTKELLENIEPGQSIAIFIGPEGGFAEEEIEHVKDYMSVISLGKRILRTETAGMTMLSILMYELEARDGSIS